MLTIKWLITLTLGYGHRDNHDLSQRFELSQGILPEFILFRRKKLDSGKKKQKKYDFDITRYGGELTVEHLKRFLKSEY